MLLGLQDSEGPTETPRLSSKILRVAKMFLYILALPSPRITQNIENLTLEVDTMQ